MKICITGGSGFIGGYVCEALRARGDEIVILDLIDPPAVNVHDRFVKGDIRDRAACDAAFAGCDVVFHLAAAHHDFGIEKKTYYDVNEGGARVMCDAMDAAGITRCVFYSTVAVYGEAAEPIDESTAPSPINPYGGSKLAGEEVFRGWCAGGGEREALVIRPTVTFGPRNFANVYSLIRQIHSGRYVTVGAASNYKSLSYVENIVAATFFLLQRRAGGGGEAFDIYNWVEKPDLTSFGIAQAIFRSMDKRMPGWRIPMWTAKLMALPFDIVIALTGKNLPISSARVHKLFAAQTKYEASKARDAGFEPGISLEGGIDRMVKWFLAGGKDESAEWHQPPADVTPYAGD